jgi:hypothetical protein
MTTRQRLDLLARAYPRLFPRTELQRLVRGQLGHVDVLDSWFVRDGVRVRARAPKIIQHICAGNLALSAWTSLMHGLLLGAHNVVKLPSEREDSSARREILEFIRGLPVPLRKLVEVQRTSDGVAPTIAFPEGLWERGEGRSQAPAEGSKPGNEVLNEADVVVAFGSDATMEAIRKQLRLDQKFIPHGHAVSLLWLADPNRLTRSQARACAVDVLTYDQLGCLSPQAIYVPRGTDIDSLGRKIARALEAHWLKLEKKPARPLSAAARIAEARDMAHALGHRVWLPPKKHLGWTLIHDPDPAFQPSPLHGVIILREVAESQIGAALASVAGRISTVGIAGQLSSRLGNVFLSLGVSRFCAAGRMQFPPLTWHHDGRSSLAELVTWVNFEAPRTAV